MVTTQKKSSRTWNVEQLSDVVSEVQGKILRAQVIIISSIVSLEWSLLYLEYHCTCLMASLLKVP